MLGNGEMIGRLALAALLGSVIGLERERLLWAAGLRTHMLVCVGSCLIMLVSIYGFADALGARNVVLDPSRVAAQVVSGIGFLGAGTILLRGEVVKGLTTAASLWAVAAIGLAIGGGLYVPAVATTTFVVAILAGVKPLEERWRDRMQTRTLRLVAKRGALSIDTLHAATGERASRVRQFVARTAEDPALDEIEVAFVRLSATSVEAIAETLRANPDVVSVETAQR
ncbi:MgtC/SapB family protein [Methylobacterium sp. WL30]|nr:MgtC/SapB family protein [Methylobacterium sp. WL116]TXN32975.1 MgtC/SapB family protein [Methylobacterium sp. WL93]TXN51594.1 MgtC/SapB family protein [Methylobacterium sp. WL119]TXN69492.1 MgtC/SapB family protein [Methylobacterium sp. WL30]